MRITSRRTTPVLALAVAVLAVAPMAAAAAPAGDEAEPDVAVSPADDGDDPDTVQPGGPDVEIDADADTTADVDGDADLDTDIDGDDPQPDAGTDDPADGTTEPQLSCPDLLLQVRPGTAPIGDEQAVAITSQSVDADVPGWLFVSWEAADGTELTAVIVERTDGATTLLPGATDAAVSDDLRTGGVPDALSLTFCGTALAAPTSPDEDGSGTDDEDGTDGSTDPSDAATGSTSGSSTPPGPSGTTGSGSAGATSPSGSVDPSDDDRSEVATSSEAPTDDEAAAPDVSSIEPADDGSAPDATSTPEQEPTADVEVLGVQFTNETTGLPAWAIWLGVLAGLVASGAAAVVLLRMRAREVAG